MALKLSKQLEGAQHFLGSTKSLPNFGQLKARQMEHVLKQLGCVMQLEMLYRLADTCRGMTQAQ